MKLSLPLSYLTSGTTLDHVDLVARLEREGLDMVWVAEAWTFDGPTTMGYLAAKTDRVTIASGILPLFSRTPTLLAMTAAGLDALSGGRAALGIGASGPQVIEGWHGVPYDRPLARTRETIEICRQVWRRDRLVHDGPCYSVPLPPTEGTGLGKPLKLLNKPYRSSIPIWVAALGGRNVELTAELADGWLPHLFLPERADRVWQEPLRAGAARRLDGLEPLLVCAGGFVAIDSPEDEKVARAMARSIVSGYIGGMGAKGYNFYNELARQYGFEEAADAIQDAFLDGRRDEAAALLPDELVDCMAITGSEAQVRDRLSAYQQAGVTHFNVVPIGSDPVALVGRLGALLP